MALYRLVAGLWHNLLEPQPYHQQGNNRDSWPFWFRENHASGDHLEWHLHREI